MTQGGFVRPTLLTDQHTIDRFRCAEPSLENWLKQRARKNQLTGASRTYVVCRDAEVVGFYCLSAGSVACEFTPGSIRRNMPDPIPVVVLGRLAVHVDWTGRGLGAGLLKDAVLRTVAAAKDIGIRALLCHAIDENARQFYLRHGFIESPIERMILMLNLAKLVAVSGE